MVQADELIDDYIAAWNEKDGERRHALVARTFTADADYLDPLMQSEGHQAIATMIARVQQQYPDYRFELAAGPDAYNDRVRFTWQLVGHGGGDPVATGYDFGTRGPDGRLRSVTGFLETPPH